MTFLDRLPVIGPHRRRRAVIDAEAIRLVRSTTSAESAYRSARDLMRLARERGDGADEALYSRVAVRIAAVTGRSIGKGVSPRYGVPTHRIHGDRILPLRGVT
jgi:hypothetical protein